MSLPDSRSTLTRGLKYSLGALVKKKILSPPDQKDYRYAYEMAYNLAVSELSGVDDLRQLCSKSDAQLKTAGTRTVISIVYLNRVYRIRFPDISISLPDSKEIVPLKDKLLILHYLIRAKGTPPTDKVITFRELPEGASYFPNFFQRAIKPIMDNFGSESQRLLDSAEKMGGYRADYGDTAVTFNAFSRIAITLVLWRGDDEFAPRANILFSSTISDYLATEDITVLCETIVWRLVRAKSVIDKPGETAGEK